MTMCLCAECESHDRDRYVVERWFDGEHLGDVFETSALSEALDQAEAHESHYGGASRFRVWDNEQEVYRYSEEDEEDAAREG
jgi:hypothetical protein